MKFKAFTLLLMSGALLVGCNKSINEDTEFTVHFNTNTSYEVNGVSDQSIRYNHRAKKPNVFCLDEELTNRYVVFGWYTSPDFETEWVFKQNRVTEDVNLYARWGYQYNVNYYIGNELSPSYTVTVKQGEKVKENAKYAAGFLYEGSYLDPNYTTPFDFSTRIWDDTNIYIKTSESIYLSESNPSGKLSNYLEAVKESAGVVDGKVPKAGTVETTSLTINGETNDYTRCNFGYSPTNGDAYMELAMDVDISSSQALSFTFKNLGHSKEFKLYYTTRIDIESDTYSLTGNDYSENFMGIYKLSDDECNMNEDDDKWITKVFDFTLPNCTPDDGYYEVDKYYGKNYRNGYCVWGSSPYLGSLRIQFSYVSTDQTDYSNEVIFKEIKGIKKDVKVVDSEDINNIVNQKNDDETVLNNTSEKQSQINGFIFPKNRDAVTSYINANVYNKTTGLILYTQNEVDLRKKNYTNSNLTLSADNIPEVNLSDYSTLKISLRNYGYRGQIKLTICNDKNNRLETSINIAARSTEFSTYLVNLCSNNLMTGKLCKIEITYVSIGIDNLIEFQSIYFDEYQPYDHTGINFNDRNSLGFNDNEDISVSYYKESKTRKTTLFNVTNSGATLETSFDYSFTNIGYQSSSLVFYKVADSNITEVKVSYKINGEYDTYSFVIPSTSIVGRKSTVSIDFNSLKRGYITGLKLEFIGTGKIEIATIDFNVNTETSMNLARDYTNTMYSNWCSFGQYIYDESYDASLIIPNVGETCSWRNYFGACYSNFHINYPTANVNLDGKSKLKIIYNNPSKTTALGLIFGYSLDELGSGDTGDDYNIHASTNLKTSMSCFNWEVLEVDLPTDLSSQWLLARLTLNYAGTSLYVRAIIVE